MYNRSLKCNRRDKRPTNPVCIRLLMTRGEGFPFNRSRPTTGLRRPRIGASRTRARFRGDTCAARVCPPPCVLSFARRSADSSVDGESRPRTSFFVGFRRSRRRKSRFASWPSPLPGVAFPSLPGRRRSSDPISRVLTRTRCLIPLPHAGG